MMFVTNISKNIKDTRSGSDVIRTNPCVGLNDDDQFLELEIS